MKYPNAQDGFRSKLRLPALACGAAMLFLIGCAGTGSGSGSRNLALIQASRDGDRAEVVSLIRKGADINAKDPEGWTPYLAASAAGNWEIMHLLQGMGCKTDPGF